MPDANTKKWLRESLRQALAPAWFLCAFSGIAGSSMYASTVTGFPQPFYNAFGIAENPHLLRDGAMLLILASALNLLALVGHRLPAAWTGATTTGRALPGARIAARVANLAVISHYIIETFLFHELNWVPVISLLVLLVVLAIWPRTTDSDLAEESAAEDRRKKA